MLRACETVFACKRICALQGRRRRGLHFHYEEQQRQKAGKMCNLPCRAHTRFQAGTVPQAGRMRPEFPATPCSALTQLVMLVERMKVNVHAAYQIKVSGQQRNLGSRSRLGADVYAVYIEHCRCEIGRFEKFVEMSLKRRLVLTKEAQLSSAIDAQNLGKPYE